MLNGFLGFIPPVVMLVGEDGRDCDKNPKDWPGAAVVKHDFLKASQLPNA
jgi:hypothetical protein